MSFWLCRTSTLDQLAFLSELELPCTSSVVNVPLHLYHFPNQLIQPGLASQLGHVGSEEVPLPLLLLDAHSQPPNVFILPSQRA